jgi:hypothetical protein
MAHTLLNTPIVSPCLPFLSSLFFFLLARLHDVFNPSLSTWGSFWCSAQALLCLR